MRIACRLLSYRTHGRIVEGHKEEKEGVFGAAWRVWDGAGKRPAQARAGSVVSAVSWKRLWDWASARRANHSGREIGTWAPHDGLGAVNVAGLTNCDQASPNTTVWAVGKPDPFVHAPLATVVTADPAAIHDSWSQHGLASAGWTQ